MHSINDETIIVLDFETSGISPDYGDRAIEIGAVKLKAGQVVDRFQSLMNPEIHVSSFIADYTGITNQMVQSAPGASEVMHEFVDFIGDAPLVAHNAAFDRRFLNAELKRIDQAPKLNFGCSLLVARRLYPEAPNHKLETLVRYKMLPSDGLFHRALADAEMTASLWIAMITDLQLCYGLDSVSFALMRKLSKIPRTQVRTYLKRQLSL